MKTGPNFAQYKSPSEIPQLVKKRGDEALLTCVVQNFLGQPEQRGYLIGFEKMNSYNSAVSGGTRHFTTENSGPNGEPILGVVRFWLRTDEGGRIAEFETWEDFRSFLGRLRASDFETIS